MSSAIALLVDAVFGNVGSIVSFQVGSDDAVRLLTLKFQTFQNVTLLSA